MADKLISFGLFSCVGYTFIGGTVNLWMGLAQVNHEAHTCGTFEAVFGVVCLLAVSAFALGLWLDGRIEEAL